MFSLIAPAVESSKLHGAWLFVHGNSMATQCKVVINFILYNVLISHNLHVIVIIALFFKHIIELKLWCLPLLCHLNKSIDLIHLHYFFLLLLLHYLFYLWLRHYSTIWYYQFRLHFCWRLYLLFTFFALHFIYQK